MPTTFNITHFRLLTVIDLYLRPFYSTMCVFIYSFDKLVAYLQDNITVILEYNNYSQIIFEEI